MRGADRHGTPGDLITEYLDQLRAGLRVSQPEAELILAEAEDHLRETAAAGIVIGLTEREAQDAAIVSFGPVETVVHAHLSRRGRIGVVAGEAALAAWKLLSVLLLSCGAGALVTMILGPRRLVPFGPDATLVPVGRSWPAWTGTLWSTADMDLLRLTWSAAAASGLALLAGYGLVRRRQPRGGRSRAPRRSRLFPAVAAGFFGAVTLGLFVFNMSRTPAQFNPGLSIVAFLALAVGYGIQMGRALLRKDLLRHARIGTLTGGAAATTCLPVRPVAPTMSTLSIGVDAGIATSIHFSFGADRSHGLAVPDGRIGGAAAVLGRGIGNALGVAVSGSIVADATRQLRKRHDGRDGSRQSLSVTCRLPGPNRHNG